MCTLTFIPKSNDRFIITSNRDEAPGRETLLPEVYSENGSQLLYPKDSLAGGTWIGLSDKKRIVSLLNGGFEAHERQESYRMSRGIIVKDLLTADDVLSKVKNYDFDGIEPFTIIMVDWKKQLRIYELVWDGSQPHFSEKPLAPQIWSSALLYNEEMQQKRQLWFSEFLFEYINPSEENLMDFHRTAGDGNVESDLIMDRGFVKTKSITQISIKEKTQMRYEDLETGVSIDKDFVLS